MDSLLGRRDAQRAQSTKFEPKVVHYVALNFARFFSAGSASKSATGHSQAKMQGSFWDRPIGIWNAEQFGQDQLGQNMYAKNRVK